jgi:hypothetical protein
MNDKIKIWLARPYSWSQHNSFAYDREQWFQGYILGERGMASSAMLYGNVVGESIATDTPLSGVPRQVHMEYEVKTKLGNIDLIGFFDSYSCGSGRCCPANEKRLEEYKTSQNVTKWNKKSVDEHGQLTYYAMLMYLRDKVKPEDIHMRLHWIPTAEQADFTVAVSGKHQTFPTMRTMKDVFSLMVEIKKRRKEMKAYAEKRLAELD